MAKPCVEQLYETPTLNHSSREYSYSGNSIPFSFLSVSEPLNSYIEWWIPNWVDGFEKEGHFCKRFSLACFEIQFNKQTQPHDSIMRMLENLKGRFGCLFPILDIPLWSRLANHIQICDNLSLSSTRYWEKLKFTIFPSIRAIRLFYHILWIYSIDTLAYVEWQRCVLRVRKNPNESFSQKPIIPLAFLLLFSFLAGFGESDFDPIGKTGKCQIPTAFAKYVFNSLSFSLFLRIVANDECANRFEICLFATTDGSLSSNERSENRDLLAFPNWIKLPRDWIGGFAEIGCSQTKKERRETQQNEQDGDLDDGRTRFHSYSFSEWEKCGFL